MYSLIAGLTAMQTLLLLSGSLIVTWTILFTVLEILRLAGRSRIVEDEDLEIPRVLIVQPSTGDPYPHHEHYAERGGLDQGQLTSHLPESTPLIVELRRRRGDKSRT